MFGHIYLDRYSGVSIKQVGWNKRVRWRKMENSIKELDGINKLVGKAKNELVGNLRIFKINSKYHG